MTDLGHYKGIVRHQTGIRLRGAADPSKVSIGRAKFQILKEMLREPLRAPLRALAEEERFWGCNPGHSKPKDIS